MSRAELRAQTDEALLQRYLTGELGAMEVLLERYTTPLYNFALRMVRDAGRAEDLAQEALLRLVQRGDTFEGQAKLRTWLYRVTRNLCLDHVRKQAHRRHPSLDGPAKGTEEGAGGSLHDRLPALAPDAERQAASRQLGREIAQAVEALPPAQREVFLMRHLEGLPFREIAEATGVTESTVKSRMRYALERLQASLHEYQGYTAELGR